MKIGFTLLLSFTFLLFGCSHFFPQRYPAGKAVTQTEKEVLEVFEFRASGKVTNKDYRQVIQDFIDTNRTFAGTYMTGNEVALEFIEDATLPKGVAFFPELQVMDNSYKILILHSKEAIHDPVASAELLSFLKELSDPKLFMSHFAAFEMYFNAMEKDPIATQNWAIVRETAAKNFVPSAFSGEDVTEELKIRGEDWAREKEDYGPAVQEALKEMRKKDSERRAVIDALDKATDDKQFKNLVAMNDRKGAADLLKKYLPWEQMAPFEQKFWENYLDTMVNPLPMDKRIFIYRGVNDDFIFSSYKNGKELPKEIAQKNGDVFVMSTILTKNQGSWNRRLRSLTAMYEKFIATDIELKSEHTKSARIVTMFVNHSRDPKGSPFLSFTPKFDVAKRFGSNKMMAYAIDPRLINFNFASKYKEEVEFLLPLMAFPDDVVAYYDNKIHTEGSISEETMKKLFREKLNAKYGETEAEKIYKKVLENSTSFFDSALNRYQGKVTSAVTPKEPNFMVKLFSKIFSNEKPATPPVIKEPVKPAGTACMDIITLFWK